MTSSRERAKYIFGVKNLDEARELIASLGIFWDKKIKYKKSHFLWMNGNKIVASYSYKKKQISFLKEITLIENPEQQEPIQAVPEHAHNRQIQILQAQVQNPQVSSQLPRLRPM